MPDAASPREFGFELALCSHLEAETDWVVGRQLGAAVARPGRRIADVVGVVPGAAFDDRAAITPETIPTGVVESDVGAGRAVPRRRAVRESDALRDAAVDAAIEAGFLTSERPWAPQYVRQAVSEPDA